MSSFTGSGLRKGVRFEKHKRMMSERSWLKLLQQYRAIAVIRAASFELGYEMATAAAKGGIRLIEITWNSDRPEDLIDVLRSDLPLCTIGAGTLLNQGDLHRAIDAGAQFLFTPHTEPALIQIAAAAGIPIIPGALSPTEIVTAWHAGANCVKVFPISAVGGPLYIQSLHGPLGHIPLIPTGGVNLKNAIYFLKAGAIAVGLSGDLFPKPLVAEGNWEAISDQAKILTLSIQNFNHN
jgi:2-dehydro-3-deoxyphosphogluconate aldolase / (4S)-4-hydroxy-2-oxoglutarate aldolase